MGRLPTLDQSYGLPQGLDCLLGVPPEFGRRMVKELMLHAHRTLAGLLVAGGMQGSSRMEWVYLQAWGKVGCTPSLNGFVRCGKCALNSASRRT
jgi:hypothetical protein